VEEPVDPPEAPGEVAGPGAGGVGVEQVHDAAVPAVLGKAEVGGDRVEALLVAIGGGEGRAVLGEAAGDDRAQASPGPGYRDHSPLEVAHAAARSRSPACGRSAGSSLGASCE
jgi:hypothetical protein